MLKIAICDDDPMQCKLLIKTLTLWLDLQGIIYTYYEFNNGYELIESYNTNHFDLIFLDIEMPTLSGMEVAAALREIDNYSLLIFITAYPDYVFQGYEVHAFHYILKPYKESKIIEVTKNAIAALDKRADDYFLIPQGSSSYRIKLTEVLYFSSEKRKIIVHRKGEMPFEYYGKLDDLSKKLPDYFCRIHQRYLINLQAIQAVKEHEVLLDDQLLPISRACKSDFMIAFAQFMLKEG